jgi:hypothetical protein
VRTAKPVVFPLLALLALYACSPADDFFEREKKLYSQFDEELIIRHFFEDREGGFFVDVGCSTPTENSTTYYLEKHLGWTGIGIDALPEHAEPWRRERPGSRFFSFLVSDRSDEMGTFYRSAVTGLSSTEQNRKITIEGKDYTVEGQEMQLPTVTLTKLLDDLGVTNVDFVSMDIELSEPPALAGFDIERFAPELVCIEAGQPVRQQLLDYFDQHGYERIDAYLERDKANWYFRPKG